MNVYFEDKYGKQRIIGTAECDEDISKIICNFLAAYKYKSYYQRTWRSSNGDLRIDVGSHSEFFVVKNE